MRRGLLIANSVTYSDVSKSIPRATVKSVVSELADYLTGLSPGFEFDETPPIIDEGHAKARERIRKQIRRSNKASPLLIYYFGHAMNDPYRKELYLYFRDSEAEDPGSMISLSDMAKWLEIYKVKSVVLMLDCCYAGTGAKALRLSDSVESGYLMASVNSQEKAMIDYEGERAYGVFSNYMLQAFKDPAARAEARNVTFKSFFRYIRNEIKENSKQLPYEHDVNLGDEVFFVQTSEPVIPEAFRETTPRKAIYRKLFVIAAEISAKGEQSEKYLYAILKKRKQDEFLQPRKVGADTVSYEFVSATAFNRYIRLAVLLGIITQKDLLVLTPDGKAMVERAGRSFNSTLHRLVTAVWSRCGFKLTDFEDAIYRRMKHGLAPSLRGVHRDLTLSKPLGISKDLFNILFDLTGYVGALSYSDEKTFFPPRGKKEL
jgi:hypothetical protein